jgi:hypothetical protein
MMWDRTIGPHDGMVLRGKRRGKISQMNIDLSRVRFLFTPPSLLWSRKSLGGFIHYQSLTASGELELPRTVLYTYSYCLSRLFLIWLQSFSRLIKIQGIFSGYSVAIKPSNMPIPTKASVCHASLFSTTY